MWVFYARLSIFSSLNEVFVSEIEDYDFRTSMFDMVILALWRLIILELSYGIFKWRKPWAAGVATTGTCVVCLLKIFYFTRFQKRVPNAESDIFDYVLVISSFIVTWVETWFLDFRVLPKEKAAREIEGLRDSASAPLLGNVRMPPPYSVPSEPYFSPIGSDDESETEDANANAYAGDGFDVAEHLRLAEEILGEGLQLIEDDSEWKLGSTHREAGRIFTNKSLRKKIIYKLEGVIGGSCELLYNDMIENVAESPRWNTTLLSVERVAKLDNNTDILYNVVKELLGGTVSSRDFVLLRRWRTMPDGCCAVASVSIEHPACPRNRENVRGHNGPCIVAMAPIIENGKEMTDFKWILDSDPKGWLPQTIVDKAMFSVMTDFVVSLQKHADTMFQNSTVNSSAIDLYRDEEFLSTPSSPSG